LTYRINHTGLDTTTACYKNSTAELTDTVDTTWVVAQPFVYKNLNPFDQAQSVADSEHIV